MDAGRPAEPAKQQGTLSIYDRQTTSRIAVKAVQPFGITRIDHVDRLIGGMFGGELQVPARPALSTSAHRVLTFAL